MTFELLNVKPEIIKALHREGIKIPTQIQEKAIPLIRSGKDVIGMSNTGSGKTAAFGVPILEKVEAKAGLQVLIIAPTRELALQISEELAKFGRYLNFSIATVFGGVALDPQTEKIARSEIVVGTPGRLVDHLNRQNLNLTKIKCLVLDEADKMVEMGFIEDIHELLKYTNKDRQILLFGATISNEINRLKQDHMRNPEVAKASTHVKQELLKQFYYNTKQHEKFSLLVHLLKKEVTTQVIVFCSTRNTVELISKNLRLNGIKNEMIHGKLTQNKRLRVIDEFNQGKKEILVASAVAARGLDIKGVSHVFNYDLSNDPQEYIHRIGRTARAGEAGKAITLLGPRDHDSFRHIQSLFDVDVKLLQADNFEKVRFDAGAQRKRYGNRRPQKTWGVTKQNGFQSRNRGRFGA